MLALPYSPLWHTCYWGLRLTLCYLEPKASVLPMSYADPPLKHIILFSGPNSSSNYQNANYVPSEPLVKEFLDKFREAPLIGLEYVIEVLRPRQDPVNTVTTRHPNSEQ